MEPLSIKTNLSATNQISPNPAEDFIDIISSEPSSQIDILAIDGRILRTLSYADKKTSHRIDLQGLNSGKYFVKLRHQDGFSIEKIIKL
jgi:hypothetical protein